jgi:cytochrome c-type biogenesis protein CcmE
VKKQSKFVAGALAVLGVVGYLMVTGMKDSMVYYYTPDELAAKVAADPTVHEVGVKVGGRVVPGTVRFDQRTLDLRFEMTDIATGRTHFAVHYQGPLPDTFKEGRDVVAEGQLTRAGVFEATTVLTKCGSRYEGVQQPAGAES